MARELKGLSDIVTDAEGTPSDLTFKNLLTRSLSSGDTGDPVVAFKLALSILDAGSKMTLENAEYDLALAALRAWKVPNWIKARGIMWMEASEEMDVRDLGLGKKKGK